MKMILSSLTMMVALLSCNAQQSDNNQQSNSGTYTNVSNEEARELMATYPNLQIIDVRTDGEVAQGMIEGAVQIDISKANFKESLNKLDKNAPVLVYCASGGRSVSAQEAMKELGFKEVHNLTNGYSRWP